MRIAVVSPSFHELQHRVRGTGFYIKNLEDALKKYYPSNFYFFGPEKETPKNMDIIHYPYFEPFFLTVPFLKKAKTMITVHDLIPLIFPNHFPKGIKGFLKWEIQKILLRNADCIITDSNSSKKDIARFTGIEDPKIKVVYLAPSDKFKKIENPKIKSNLPDKFVLYVGDVTWNKNLPRLVDAIKKLDLTLVMVGKVLKDRDFDKNNSWNRDLLIVDSLTRNNRKIIKLGFISDEELIMLYNKATVFVMPSLYEGFGLPLLEAMSCGCPVVTSKEGSIPEIAGDAAIYVDPYNVNDISSGIKKVFFDKEVQKKMIEKGLEQAKKFSWEKTSKQMVQIYKNLHER